MDVRLAALGRPVTVEEAAFVAGCLRELFVGVGGRVEELRGFLEGMGERGGEALVVVVEGARAGVVTLVRSPMPRYLGYRYEIEELVVGEGFRGRGVARRALELVAERCAADPLARKVVVRSNVAAARRAYGAVFEEVDITTYQRMLHKLDRGGAEGSVGGAAEP